MPVKYNLQRYSPFTFQIGLSESVQHLIERVDYGNRMLMKMPAYSQIAEQVEQQVMVSGIVSTDTIEGGDVSEAEAGAVLLSVKAVVNNRERRIKNLANAYDYIDEYILEHQSAPLLPISEHLLKSLHSLLSDGLSDNNYHPGEYRKNLKGNTTYAYVGDNAHGGRYETPSAYADIQTLMAGLEQWSVSDEIATLSALSRAALLHYYFERIHPFSHGNGRVGRLLEKAILYHGGYQGWVKGLDRYYLAHIDDYYLAFNTCRKKEKIEPGTCNTDFISLALHGMAETIEKVHSDASNIASNMFELAILGDLLRKGTINSRQHELYESIVDYAHGSINRQALNNKRWYQSLYLGRSPATRSRDLNGLMKIGLLKKDGAVIKAKVSALSTSTPKI